MSGRDRSIKPVEVVNSELVHYIDMSVMHWRGNMWQSARANESPLLCRLMARAGWFSEKEVTCMPCVIASHERPDRETVVKRDATKETPVPAGPFKTPEKAGAR